MWFADVRGVLDGVQVIAGLSAALQDVLGSCYVGEHRNGCIGGTSSAFGNVFSVYIFQSESQISERLSCVREGFSFRRSFANLLCAVSPAGLCPDPGASGARSLLPGRHCPRGAERGPIQGGDGPG